MKKIIESEQVFLESKTLREGFVNNVDIIDKIKSIAYLSNDLVVNVEMVSDYYEVSKKAINTIIERNREELEEDGIMVLKGEELKEFKANIGYPQSEEDLKDVNPNSRNIQTSPAMTILTRRAMLRIGMLLTTSSVAVKIRSYLLNCEENSTDEQKRWAMQREVGKIDRKRMTSAIGKYIPEGKSKKFAYPNYTNCVYKVIFGKDAKAMREERGFDKNDKLRDSFTGRELELVDEAETIVTALVTLGFGYDYIKQQLQQKYQNIKLIG